AVAAELAEGDELLRRDVLVELALLRVLGADVVGVQDDVGVAALAQAPHHLVGGVGLQALGDRAAVGRLCGVKVFRHRPLPRMVAGAVRNCPESLLYSARPVLERASGCSAGASGRVYPGGL